MTEYGLGVGHVYGYTHADTGHAYYGRGYVQLTWRNNYQLWSTWLGLDLVNNPDIVTTDLDLSAKIACSGIKYGSFTGTNNGTIDTYIHADLVDYVGARKLVNGDTRKVGNRIQNDSMNYFNLLTKLMG